MNETWDNRCYAEDVSELILLLTGVIIHMSNGDVRSVCKLGQGEASSAGSHRPVLCTGHLLWGLRLTYFPHTRGDEQTHERFKEHRAKAVYEPEWPVACVVTTEEEMDGVQRVLLQTDM